MTRMLEPIVVVFCKEVLDNLRDRRSIFSALVSTLIGPIITVAMIMIVGKAIFVEYAEKQLDLPIIGAENAPGLIQFLKQNGIHVLSGPSDPQSEVLSGNLDVVLVIPKEYAEDFSAGRPAAVQLIIDSSRQSAMPSIEIIRSVLDGYEKQISNLRLLARGISPVVVSPLAIERIDLATPQSQVVIFLNMMPYFIILVVFVGGMYVVIDATAGERERNSLEPLLINPVRRWQFVLGKLLASIPFATLGVLVTLFAFTIAFNTFPLEDYVGFQLTIDPKAMFAIFLLALPMILLASALQTIIASFARSYKEAQTYVGFLPLIPALPGIGLAFMPVKPTAWTMLIPTYGQQLLINELMRSEPLDPLNVVVSTIATIITAFILILIAIQLYNNERILFSQK